MVGAAPPMVNDNHNKVRNGFHYGQSDALAANHMFGNVILIQSVVMLMMMLVTILDDGE